MTSDPETLYRQLGRLIEAMPDLNHVPVPKDVHLWLARVYALVAEVNVVESVSFTMAVNKLDTANWASAAQQIRAITYRTFAIAERKAPLGAVGAFIPAGDTFDAFSALSKVLQTAVGDVLIVDPYMDETALTEFGVAVPEKVQLRLMADQSSYKSTLQPAADKWVEQYRSNRPLLVRLAPPKTLHDRAIFVDQKAAWTLTQSLKDFAKRSPAEIVRADDTASLKIEAYEKIWASATVIV